MVDTGLYRASNVGSVRTLPAAAEASPPPATSVATATVEAAIETIAEALAPATRRAYGAAWADWESSAAAHGVVALPANPGDLVLWLSDIAYDGSGQQRLAAGTCAQRLAAVAYRHRATLDGATSEALADPTAHRRVREWLRGYRRRAATLGVGAVQQAAPLTAEAAAAIRATATAPRPGRGGRPESPEQARRRGTQDLVIVGLARDGLLRRAGGAAVGGPAPTETGGRGGERPLRGRPPSEHTSPPPSTRLPGHIPPNHPPPHVSPLPTDRDPRHPSIHDSPAQRHDSPSAHP